MNLRDIVKYGTYFNPAWKHYGSKNSKVVCDKCTLSNLKACIGYGDRDLCLSCANILLNDYNDDDYDSDIYNPTPHTIPVPPFPSHPSHPHPHTYPYPHTPFYPPSHPFSPHFSRPYSSPHLSHPLASYENRNNGLSPKSQKEEASSLSSQSSQSPSKHKNVSSY